MRIALGIEYNGKNYHGWQSQESVNSIQQEVEAALSKVADSPISVTAAGRTDRGVHAKHQIVHFDSPVHREPSAWVRGTNTYLPNDIAILWAQEVDEDFHARYSATARRYEYLIYNHPVRSALWHQLATWHYAPLNIAAMQAGAKHLIGEHDFNAYRSIECQSKTSVRELIHLNITRDKEMIVVDVKANAFLHHMVRNIVGVLLPIGEGKASPDWAKEVLESKTRCEGGVTAKPDGLYLVEVTYPNPIPNNNVMV